MIEHSAQIKAAVDVPIMVVGGVRNLQMMEDVMDTGKGDLISMCRPLIREPNLINRWTSCYTSPSTCISCDGCLKGTERHRMLRCVQVTRHDGTPKGS